MNQSAPLDPALIRDVLLYSTICVGFVVSGTTIVGAIAFFRAKKGPAKTFSLLIQRADATRIIAVLAIVIAACLLDMLGKIGSEAVVSILSGIAGYVLGGSNAKAAEEQEEETEPKTGPSIASSI